MREEKETEKDISHFKKIREEIDIIREKIRYISFKILNHSSDYLLTPTDFEKEECEYFSNLYELIPSPRFEYRPKLYEDLETINTYKNCSSDTFEKECLHRMFILNRELNYYYYPLL